MLLRPLGHTYPFLLVYNTICVAYSVKAAPKGAPIRALPLQNKAMQIYSVQAKKDKKKTLLKLEVFSKLTRYFIPYR